VQPRQCRRAFGDQCPDSRRGDGEPAESADAREQRLSDRKNLADPIVASFSGTAVEKDPSLINQEPYGKGWMIKIKSSDAAEFAKLLSVEDYLKKTGH